jgi:hypothetical protein
MHSPVVDRPLVTYLGLALTLSMGGYLLGYVGARGLGLLIRETDTELTTGSFANCDYRIRKRSPSDLGLDVAFAPLAAIESQLWRSVQPRWDFSADPRGGCGDL